MNNRTLLTTLVTGCCTMTMAQHTATVTDAETGVPIKAVQIFVNGNNSKRIITDYKGEFCIPDTAVSLTLCHPKYEKRQMEIKECPDTISMLPNYERLNELVVIGHTPKINMNITEAVKEAAITAPQSKALVTFDFFDMFTYKKRKRTRERIEAIKDY